MTGDPRISIPAWLKEAAKRPTASAVVSARASARNIYRSSNCYRKPPKYLVN